MSSGNNLVCASGKHERHSFSDWLNCQILIKLEAAWVKEQFFHENFSHKQIALKLYDVSHQKRREPQGLILVTEHNAEVNAGFTVLRGSNHTPPLREEDWQRIPLNGGVSQEPFLRECIERGGCCLLGGWSLQWFQMDGMTET